ncbi:MAG: hypothetical protein ACREEC_02965, partial [Thermoplasmata archaeon]
FRGFLRTSAGRAILLAVAIVVVGLATGYISALVGIPAMLVFGLGIPIWVGFKAPRYLALSGLVILLLAAPIANVALTQQIMTPIGASSSSNLLPVGNGGSVLQDSYVSPYVGGTSTNFTWTVTVYPQYVPAGNSTPLWLNLYISNCPGATTNNSQTCAPPYPFVVRNVSWVNGTDLYTFHYQIGSTGIWDWQLSITVRNNASHALYDIFLVGDPTYNGIEGPVVGRFGDIYASLLLDVYVEVFLYLGASFYFVLLIYMILKRRERGKADAARRAAGPTPTDDQGPSVPASTKTPESPTPRAAGIATPKEGACPNCGAVVYAGEKTCWKCGATLDQGSSGTPLQSSKSP